MSAVESTGRDEEHPSVTMAVAGVEKRYENIVKSQEDKRLYRGLELTNKLKVLLVSDPKADKAAAALDVNVGSMSDPDELPGLAHFCEHMLFLGTEKYPQENEYNKFLSENGGYCNAYTAEDHTLYYFDVLPAHLSKALDIFAQFFISPLFTESATGRELCSIDSEHEKNLPHDGNRLSQVFTSLGLPTHPYGKFATGNKDTLDTIPKSKNIDVRQELLKFYQNWYSSNIMTLVVLGKETLDELESIVVPLFSAIEDRSVTAPTWPEHPFPPELRRKKTYCVPIVDMRTLMISFPISDLRKHYKSAPGQYLSLLLQHKGTGSLFSALRRRCWCDNVYAGSWSAARGFGFFTVSLDLTEEGLDHINDIINFVFQYIALLNKEGPQCWLWEEKRDIEALDFRYKDEQDPINMVEEHSPYLQCYPFEDILATDLLSEWKPELITELLSLLTPYNMLLEIVAKKYEDVCIMTEPWYGAKYVQEDIDESLLTEWSSVEVSEDLHLPESNQFIPRNLTLVERGDGDCDTIAPAIVKDTPWIRLWYKKDAEFLVPKAYITLEIASPVVYADPVSYCLSTIWIDLLQDALKESTYAASCAGIYWNMWNSNDRITANVQGYSDKQHLLLNKVMEQILNYKADPKRFYIMKENYIRSQKNFEAASPWDHAYEQQESCLKQMFWTKHQLIEASKDITPEHLDEFSSRLIRNVHIEILIYGNVTEERAIQTAEAVENILPKDGMPLLSQQLLVTRDVELDKGAWYLIEVQNSVNRSSCAAVYYAGGPRALRSNVTLDLLAQMLYEPCYDTLRTKEQLGYVVFCSFRGANGAQGLIVTVQGNRHPEYLDQRIESFIQGYLKQLEDMTEEEFLKHRTALIASTLEKPKQMHSKSSQLWLEISSQLYNFDRANVEVEQLNTVTKEEVIQFYKKHVIQESAERSKLSVYIVSTTEEGAGCECAIINSEDDKLSQKTHQKPTKIKDLVDFKSGRSLYPIQTPFVNIPRKGVHCKL